jgi:hypothetical protein
MPAGAGEVEPTAVGNVRLHRSGDPEDGPAHSERNNQPPTTVEASESTHAASLLTAFADCRL